MIGTKVLSVREDKVGTIVSRVDDERVLVDWHLADPVPLEIEQLSELLPLPDDPLEWLTIVEPTPIHDSVVADMPRLMRRVGRRGRHLLRRAS